MLTLVLKTSVLRTVYSVLSFFIKWPTVRQTDRERERERERQADIPVRHHYSYRVPDSHMHHCQTSLECHDLNNIITDRSILLVNNWIFLIFYNRIQHLRDSCYNTGKIATRNRNKNEVKHIQTERYNKKNYNKKKKKKTIYNVHIVMNHESEARAKNT